MPDPSAEIYLDLDDFCEDNHSLELLQELRRQIPEFRVTLFTIPGRCSDAFVRRMKAEPWLDMVPHGFLHNTSRECQDWPYERMMTYLDWVESFGLTRGFKAPGWQISDGCFHALKNRGYWVADQAYNDARRPPELPAYKLDAPSKIHGHVGNLGGVNNNELSLILPAILRHKDRRFGFIKDLFLP